MGSEGLDSLFRRAGRVAGRSLAALMLATGPALAAAVLPATALATGLHDATSTTAPSLTVTPSASGGPVLIQIFNYSPSAVAYTLTKS